MVFLIGLLTYPYQKSFPKKSFLNTFMILFEQDCPEAVVHELKDRFCIQFFVLRQRPRTSLQCFALEHSCPKAKHCRDVLGRCLRTKDQIQNRSLTLQNHRGHSGYQNNTLICIPNILGLPKDDFSINFAHKNMFKGNLDCKHMISQ